MAFPACLKGFLGILSLVGSEGKTFDTSTGFQQAELKIIEVSSWKDLELKEVVKKPEFSASFSGIGNHLKLEMKEHIINPIKWKINLLCYLEETRKENICIDKAILKHYNLLPQVLAAWSLEIVS